MTVVHAAVGRAISSTAPRRCRKIRPGLRLRAHAVAAWSAPGVIQVEDRIRVRNGL
jgi:hypothetical protein